MKNEQNNESLYVSLIVLYFIVCFAFTIVLMYYTENLLLIKLFLAGSIATPLIFIDKTK